VGDQLRPSEVFARRVREVRERQRWSQDDLARRLGELGLPMDRAQVARIERMDRKVSINEVFIIALALNVAPVHLLVPVTSFEPEVLLAPKLAVTPRLARQWLRGQTALGEEDARSYFAEISDDEWSAHQKPGINVVLQLAQQLVHAVVDEDRDRAAGLIDTLHADLEVQRELHNLPQRKVEAD
jgi:transcriptional regulator with XRE-family HTH domain